MQIPHVAQDRFQVCLPTVHISEALPRSEDYRKRGPKKLISQDI
jgi:hypothetical protein